MPITIPLPLEDSGDDDMVARADRRREARGRETILVHNIVTGITTPLAQAFRAMPETGLLTTRYQLYLNTCNAVLGNDNLIPFLPHDVKIDDLLEKVWRTAKVNA